MIKQKEPGKKKQSAIRLEPELMKNLRHLAVDREMSFNALISEAVEDLLKKHKAKK